MKHLNIKPVGPTNFAGLFCPCVVCFVFIGGLGSFCENVCRTIDGKTPKEQTVGNYSHLVEMIVNVDDGLQTIESENSKVIIITASITRVVKMGPSVLPSLIAIMKEDGLSFDTFIRCYSTCDQILASADPKSKVYWVGGCKTIKTATGINRFQPDGQLNEVEFRRAVVDDIEKKCNSKTK